MEDKDTREGKRPKEASAPYSELDLYNEIKEAFPTLSREESEAAALLAKARAKTLKMELHKYKERFHAGGFARSEETPDAQYKGHASFDADAQAILKAGRSADFSAFVHESADIFRRQLTGNLRKKAERAFGVERFGMWTVERKKAFAAGLEEYVKGRKPSESARGDVFEKGCEFIRNMYNGLDRIIDIAPEAREIYEKAFQADRTEINGEEFVFNQKEFEDKIHAIAEGGARETPLLSLGATPPVYEELGLGRLPMMMTRKHVYTTINGKGRYTEREANYHDLGEELFKRIPEKLKDPLAVFQDSGSRAKDIVSVIELRDKEGKQIIIPIEQNVKKEIRALKITFNLAKSVYGDSRIKRELSDAIKEDRILYLNKKRDLTPLLPNRLATADVRAGVQKASVSATGSPANDHFNVSGFYINNIARYKRFVKRVFEENKQPKEAVMEAMESGRSEEAERREGTGGGGEPRVEEEGARDEAAARKKAGSPDATVSRETLLEWARERMPDIYQKISGYQAKLPSVTSKSVAGETRRAISGKTQDLRAAHRLIELKQWDRTEFEKDVDRIANAQSARDFHKEHVCFGLTPPVYSGVGYEQTPLFMRNVHVYTCANAGGFIKMVNHEPAHYHGLTAEALKQMPEKLAEPVFILQSHTQKASITAILDFTDKNGDPLLAALQPFGSGSLHSLSVSGNIITSIYGKNNFERWFYNAVKPEEILYEDTKKSRQFLPTSSARTNGVDHINGFYINNIARYKTFVKRVSEEKSAFQENKQPKEAVMEVMENGRSEEAEHRNETGGGGVPSPSGEGAAVAVESKQEPAASAEMEEEDWRSDAEKGIDLMREYMRANADFKRGEQSESACLSAVNGHWYMLKHIDPRFKTYKACMRAVRQSGRALQFVEKGALKKEELFEICKEAVRKTPEAVRWVKDEFGFDKRGMDALCVEAVKADVSALGHMKDEWKTDAVLKRAVAENGLALERVKMEDRSSELCALAVASNPFALKHAPEKAQTSEMCMAAVKSAGNVLRHVREDLKTPEVCFEAVRRWGAALEYAPEKARTPELCMLAVKENGYNLRYAREQTPELCLEAVRRTGDALKYVKEKTPEVCLEAVKKDRGALIHLFPEEARPVGDTPPGFEANVKTLVAERSFKAKDAAGILIAGMEEAAAARLAGFLKEKLKADGAPSIAALFEKWEAEARAEARQTRSEAEPLKAEEADMFLESLGTKEFYKHPDAAVKEVYYAEHLKESLKKGYEQPVFSIGGEGADAAKPKLLAKLFGKDRGESPDNLLNPFSPEAVERMKEAAKIGVVFADEKRRDEQLAFMKERLPEVHKIVMETLRRQEKREPRPLFIGDTRMEMGVSPSRKPPAPDRGR